MPKNMGTYTLRMSEIPQTIALVEAAVEVLEEAGRKGNLRSYDLVLAKLHKAVEAFATIEQQREE